MILLAVSPWVASQPGERPQQFMGANAFFSLAARAGLSASDFFIYDVSAPSEPPDCTTALCIGKEAFAAFTGIEGNITKLRGYIFFPSDCRNITVKEKGIIGTYKTSRKKDGILIHKSGDPKLGTITRSIPSMCPPCIKWIIPTFSMAQNRQSGFIYGPAIKADLLRAKRFALGEADILYMPITPWTHQFRGARLTLDIETLGFTSAISQIALSDGENTVSLPWTPEARRITQSAIDACAVVQGHNLAFDIPRLELDGINFTGKQRFDSLLAMALLLPELPRALEKVATLFLNLRPWKHLATSDLARYNALDAFITHHLIDKQLSELERKGMLDLFTKTIMPATVTLINMTRHGIKVDMPRLAAWQTKLRAELSVLNTEWTTHAPGVNWQSVPQLTNFLYRTLKLTPQYSKRRTSPLNGRRPSGTKSLYSVDIEAINNLTTLHSNYYSMLACLSKLKKIHKTYSTYATIEFPESDECVHPSYLPSTHFAKEDDNYASTGRLASSNPNIQNQTLESKRMFIPHFPTHALVEFDYSQIELRIAAAQSKDRALIEALKGDVHARTMELLGCDRTRAKNIMYGTMYGAGPAKLCRVLNAKGSKTTIAECEKLQNTFARAYPDLWAWRTLIAIDGVANKYLTNPFGRRRYFFAGSEAIPEMYDYIPQSTAADILWSILVDCEQFALRRNGLFLTTTHDSGLFELHMDWCTPECIAELRSICERPFPNVGDDFFVPINLKVGLNWSDMQPIDERSVGHTISSLKEQQECLAKAI